MTVMDMKQEIIVYLFRTSVESDALNTVKARGVPQTTLNTRSFVTVCAVFISEPFPSNLRTFGCNFSQLNVAKTIPGNLVIYSSIFSIRVSVFKEILYRLYFSVTIIK